METYTGSESNRGSSFGSNIGSSVGGEEREQREGPVARNIERQTAKLPSDLFLWAAGASILGSLVFQVIGMRKEAQSVGPVQSFLKRTEPNVASAPLASFIGMWVPSLLLLGVYNKIVKVAGSDRYSERFSR